MTSITKTDKGTKGLICVCGVRLNGLEKSLEIWWTGENEHLKAHYATFLAKITLSMQVESYADGSASISGSILKSILENVVRL
jgi:hypothetical protein